MTHYAGMMGQSQALLEVRERPSVILTNPCACRFANDEENGSTSSVIPTVASLRAERRDLTVGRGAQIREIPRLRSQAPSARDDRLGLLAVLDEVGHALRDHHGGDVGVGADAVGHDRGIDDAEVRDAVHLAVLIHHGHRV